MIKYLAGLGDVNVKDNYGSTALHFAAMRGNASAAAALVTVKGINANVRFEFSNRWSEILKFLIARGPQKYLLLCSNV